MAEAKQAYYTAEQEAHIRSIKRRCAHPKITDEGIGTCDYDVNELVLQSPPGEPVNVECPGCGNKHLIIGPVFPE